MISAIPNHHSIHRHTIRNRVADFRAQFFQDLAETDLDPGSKATLGDLSPALQDVVAGITMFLLVTVFKHVARRGRPREHRHGLAEYVDRKKVVSLALTVLFFGLAAHSIWEFVLQLAHGSPDAFRGRTEFYADVFTVMIFTDVLILLLSLLVSDDYEMVFRNAAFVISTILIRFSLSGGHPLGAEIGVAGMVFGILTVLIYNYHLKLDVPLLRKKCNVSTFIFVEPCKGVGFRPFVYRLATELELKGHVLNISGGVIAEIEGPEPAVASFLARLRAEAPPLSEIDHIDVQEQPPAGDLTFAIHHSVTDAARFAMVPADIGTCDECYADFTDPSNRRYLYPFTNCTNCGPRYSIIQDIPYDRPQTTMSVFPMCADCLREYEDPANRRFHAQPNACPVCGPALSESMAEIRRRLHAGEILAIKGLGGFHLACDAENHGGRQPSARTKASQRQSLRPDGPRTRIREANRHRE